MKQKYIVANNDYRRYGKGILFSNGYALNETATFIFDHCNGFSSVDDIVHAFLDEYDCDNADSCTKDVLDCIFYLLESNLVSEVVE